VQERQMSGTISAPWVEQSHGRCDGSLKKRLGNDVSLGLRAAPNRRVPSRQRLEAQKDGRQAGNVRIAGRVQRLT
jgi:hypothetical protein